MRHLLINATNDHLPLIHRLAHEIWPQTFKNVLTTGQIKYMLEWMYSLPSLEQQRQSGYQFILIKDDRYYGYCSYRHEEVRTTLSKIYILPEMQGKGAGKALLNEVINRSREKNQKAIRLHVNRYNKAISFYKRSGFKIMGKEDNDIGGGYFMNDYIMELKL